MRRFSIGNAPFLESLTIVLLACLPLYAQEQPQSDDNSGISAGLYTSSLPFAVPEPGKIVPVRILREFELGPELERFASTCNLLVERREIDLEEAAWKVDDMTTIVPTAVVVRNALQVNNRRLGARLGYLPRTPSTAGAGEEYTSYMVDLDELRHLEIVLDAMVKAMERSPSRSEVVSYQYRTRSGFAVSLMMTQKQGEVVVKATVGKAAGNSREEARRMFEGFSTLTHRLIQFLAAY